MKNRHVLAKKCGFDRQFQCIEAIFASDDDVFICFLPFHCCLFLPHQKVHKSNSQGTKKALPIRKSLCYWLGRCLYSYVRYANRFFCFRQSGTCTFLSRMKSCLIQSTCSDLSHEPIGYICAVSSQDLPLPSGRSSILRLE